MSSHALPHLNAHRWYEAQAASDWISDETVNQIDEATAEFLAGVANEQRT